MLHKCWTDPLASFSLSELEPPLASQPGRLCPSKELIKCTATSQLLKNSTISLPLAAVSKPCLLIILDQGQFYITTLLVLS